jgi:hypothetical protein
VHGALHARAMCVRCACDVCTRARFSRVEINEPHCQSDRPMQWVCYLLVFVRLVSQLLCRMRCCILCMRAVVCGFCSMYVVVQPTMCVCLCALCARLCANSSKVHYYPSFPMVCHAPRAQLCRSYSCLHCRGFNRFLSGNKQGFVGATTTQITSTYPRTCICVLH